MQVQTVYTSHSFRSSRAAHLVKFINWSEEVIKYTGQYETCNLYLPHNEMITSILSRLPFLLLSSSSIKH
jgi:hypothetical protein